MQLSVSTRSSSASATATMSSWTRKRWPRPGATSTSRPNTDSIAFRQALIETLVFEAAPHELSDRRAAEESPERALKLAGPERIVLPFVLVPLQDLLQRLPRYRNAHAAQVRTILDVLADSSAAIRSESAPLRAGISDAELRVIRYLPSNLKTREIAAELGLSGNTVRTHISRIYAKLGAHDRNAAVSRARELGLLARPR